MIHANIEAIFAELAACLSHAGLVVQHLAPGIIQVIPSRCGSDTASMLISVGIHGDETAPIELLMQLLNALAKEPHHLSVNLMVVIGNVDAIKKGTRYIDADMNRMFGLERVESQLTVDTQRADAIMDATTKFFRASNASKWHLDLHSTIRPSVYATFAIVPHMISEDQKKLLLNWLSGAAIDAVVFNTSLTKTYSNYTAQNFNAVSCTLELGQIGQSKENDLSTLSEVQDAVLRLLGSLDIQACERNLQYFKVTREIIKSSDDFVMSTECSEKNFVMVEQGAVIAIDGVQVHCAREGNEYILFPNPNVSLGQRAALMLKSV